ncbi:CDP-diacylglycerol--serine O-phosphatidyltransferase [Bacteroidales bacterium OttesenSCG-928-M06]|nr:CDP-diacylglycerol--serine O-phosphatidyltransferase [Bacteroidales bacterium OttesenSCG-928-M06]
MKNIPNLITCLNLLAGCMACVMALKYENYTGAFIFITFSAVFDFLDGFAARLLRTYSKLGAELDSLADVISFGLAPGCIIYIYFESISAYTPFSGFSFLAFLLPMFSAIRLAKFNVDTRQSVSFLGLPVPASSLFWASFIPSILPYTQNNPLVWLIIIFSLLIIFCLLLVSEIPMFSLKIKSIQWKGNEWPYSFILLSILTLILFYHLGLFLLGFSITVIIFIGMSLIKNTIFKS